LSATFRAAVSRPNRRCSFRQSRKRIRKFVAARRRQVPGALVEHAASANRSTPIRAFCGSSRPSARPLRSPVHNFFRGAKGVMSDVAAALKSCANDARRRAHRFRRRNLGVTKTHISSVFLRVVEILAQKRAAAKSFASMMRWPPPRPLRTPRGGGAYTQN